MSLKDALSICAMFRGTYLDYREKANALNAKYMLPEKKYERSEAEKHNALPLHR